MSEHTPTPWAIRPNEFDDWGWIRGADGVLACIARDHDNKSADEHRVDKTDPYAANAALIVEAVNNHESLKSDNARLRSELDQTREALFMCAASCQGGSSSGGQAAAKVLGVPFPLRMDSLGAKTREEGRDTRKLWPWSHCAHGSNPSTALTSTDGRP